MTTERNISLAGLGFDFTRWDIIEAHYWHAYETHAGQWSEGYETLCRLGQIFRPGPLQNGPEPDSAAAWILAALRIRDLAPGAEYCPGCGEEPDESTKRIGSAWCPWCERFITLETKEED